MTPGGGPGPAFPGRRGMAGLLIRLTVNLAAPVLGYVLLRPHVHSDVAALVAGAAVPVAYTGVVLLWRRRLDAIGAFAIACFGIGLLLVVATGGNELVFKLREDIWTGAAGLAGLISVAAGPCSPWSGSSQRAVTPSSPSGPATRTPGGYRP